MRVAALGRTRLLYDSIDRILDSGHEIVLIGTCSAAVEYDIKEDDFRRKADLIGVPFFNDSRINSDEIVNLMKSVEADIAISVNWLTIIKEEAISCFRYGILNAHCGDLPRYRGNACPNWAILEGEPNYALSIHYMEAGSLDSGNILIKKYYPIDENTYISDIYEILNKEIPYLFCEAISMISEGDSEGMEQSKSIDDALRCYPRIPNDGYIDWNDSSENILRNIRASGYPFQGAFCFYNDLKICIFKAIKSDFIMPCLVNPGQVIKIDNKTGYVDVAAKDGIIRFNRLVIDGEKYVASDILNSTRIRLNYCMPYEIYLLKRELRQIKELVNKLLS